MNNHMYEHPATQANLELLRTRGATIVAPEQRPPGLEGRVGRGPAGRPGHRVRARSSRSCGSAGGPLDGLRVLVTAGGTREPIDSVRYVGNRSSGRMGLALAEEAARRGAEVTLIAANVALDAPAGIRTLAVESAAELLEAARAEFAGADVLLMAAAVADFRPGRRARRQDRQERARRPGARARAHRRRAGRRWPARACRARRSWASPPSTARAPWSAAGPSSSARASTPWW